MADTTSETTIKIIFNVEDGTNVSNANSYISLDDAIQFMANKGRTDWIALSDEEKKVTLIKGTQYVDNLYEWNGRRKFEEQTLSFPRIPDFGRHLLLDADGYDYTGKIPRKLKEAVCEAAFYGFQANAELWSTIDNQSGIVKRQRVEGAVEVEFFNSSDSEVEYISKYASLDLLLKGLFRPKGKNCVNARALWES